MVVVSDEGLTGLAFYSVLSGIGRLSVRVSYYHESHKRRWEGRYKRPYPPGCGKIGTFSGVRWLTGR